jgi:hypothetical protein
VDEVRGVLVDATAAYPVVSSLLGTSSWLEAARIEQRHLTSGRGLARLVRELEAITVDRLLDEPDLWSSLAGLALVDTDADPIAIRGRVVGTIEDHTGTVPVAPGSGPIWCGLPRVVAARLRTGRMPAILEAYTFRPVGLVAGARPVRLLGGIVFDPRLDRPRRVRRFRDLPLALAEVGMLAKAGALRGCDVAQMRRLKGSVKVARNVAAYGGPVEYNPSTTAQSAWGPDGTLAKRINEEPGWLTDPVAGSLVVSGCELLITIFEVLDRDAGGAISFVDTDAAFVLVTDDAHTVSIVGAGANGGPVATEACTITPTTLVRILMRFGPIARFTGLSIPVQDLELPNGRTFRVRSVFKLTDENFDDDGRWAQNLVCHAVAKKRYVLSRVDKSGEPISAKASAHVIGALANFRTDGVVDQARVNEAWRIAPMLVADGPSSSDVLDLSEPVLQPLTLAHPSDWRALRRLCFSSLNPDGIRPFETVLVPVPLGRPRARLVTRFEPDRSRWPTLEFRDPDGKPWSVRTPAEVGRFFAASPSRVQVVPDVRTWLRDYMSSPEPLALGPDGQPCSERTVGALTPIPVRIVARRVGGQEPHRRRDEEAVGGWDVQRAQLELARTCRAPGCNEALVDRQRLWCERHKRYPGTRRKRWVQAERTP